MWGANGFCCQYVDRSTHLHNRWRIVRRGQLRDVRSQLQAQIPLHVAHRPLQRDGS